MLKEYIQYIKNNPEGYWFRQKLYGWGWIPVKWQGWLIVAIAVAIIIICIDIGDTDDAPGMALLGMLLATAILFAFGYRKGEKPCWRWGRPKEEDQKD